MDDIKIPVVIRYIDIYKRWFICYEVNYQNAFRNEGFASRHEAVRFAQELDCEVIKHDFDELQNIES